MARFDGIGHANFGGNANAPGQHHIAGDPKKGQVRRDFRHLVAFRTLGKGNSSIISKGFVAPCKPAQVAGNSLVAFMILTFASQLSETGCEC